MLPTRPSFLEERFVTTFGKLILQRNQNDHSFLFFTPRQQLLVSVNQFLTIAYQQKNQQRPLARLYSLASRAPGRLARLYSSLDQILVVNWCLRTKKNHRPASFWCCTVRHYWFCTHFWRVKVCAMAKHLPKRSVQLALASRPQFFGRVQIGTAAKSPPHAAVQLAHPASAWQIDAYGPYRQAFGRLLPAPKLYSRSVACQKPPLK